ncbi:hypothetical protein WJX72_009591 [[Myrmecia] bisecta]|uniref:Calcineurin-like phosphoesterase domain-containing protein n=1 Tax=[Myrmecia] bisecta TaxID=41462 RepID=A0AAW1Q816_9CHLO
MPNRDSSMKTAQDEARTPRQNVLVQTGDIVDRGPNSLELVRYFERLKEQAREAGGQVYTLLGNHEAMNLLGQYQYVNRAELTRLGLQPVKQPLLGAQQPKKLPLELGLQRWHELMQPGSETGDLLLSRPTAVVLGSGACRTLFVHGGLVPELLDLASQGEASASTPEALLAQLNVLMQGALRKCAGTAGCPRSAPEFDFLYGPYSPIWYRG